uniref:Gustatory receptor n=1 Tax=Strongyloides venezuelensis TaxID=75913 RepID=A0A0K0FV18_STRVS
MEKAENNIGPYEYIYNVESQNKYVFDSIYIFTSKFIISKHYPNMATSSFLKKILTTVFTVVIFVPLVVSLVWHILAESQSSRNFTSIRIKLLLLWFVLLASFTYELVVNILNYEKNESEGKKYKLSKFYGKETYIVDCMIMVYSRLIIAIMVSIYLCIYEVVSFESETFEKECKYFIEEDLNNLSSNIDIISKKHVRLFKLITLSHTTIGTYTDPIVMQSVITIFMAVPIIRYYFSTVSDIIQAINYIIVLVSFALIMVLHLSSISNTVKSLRNIKNIILNSPQIWDNVNSKVHETALSIISRTDHCEYNGKILNLIPLDDKTIVILLITIHIAAFFAGVATV